jgi:hypothetical protein
MYELVIGIAIVIITIVIVDIESRARWMNVNLLNVQK